MSNQDINQAREWAHDNINGWHFTGSDRALAAARVIQSLPDTVVDGDKLREVINKVLANTIHGTVGHQVAEDYAALIGELIPAPSLPTLAELIEQGNDPQKYQWMQCTVDGSRDHAFVIAVVGERFNKVLRPDGPHQVMSNDRVTPLPDLPKLEWPGSAPDDVAYATGGALTTQDVVDECRAVRKERALPRPEDIRPGDPWSVQHEGLEWVGVRADDHGYYPWGIIRTDGIDYQDVADAEITLISRLVPKTP